VVEIGTGRQKYLFEVFKGPDSLSRYIRAGHVSGIRNQAKLAADKNEGLRNDGLGIGSNGRRRIGGKNGCDLQDIFSFHMT